ncbi:MAG: DEAD/DEAH box helicase [Nitrospirae bacterium]|nr:DEAD/DEAH box helicase [Nitrospirota bacterium]
MSDSHSQGLLNLLNSYPAGSIYTLAPKDYVYRGFDYFRKDRLLDFKWADDGSSLAATVKGSRSYSVVFSVNGRGLTFSCDCPAWSYSTHCKHVICSLLTIKHLFHQGAFLKRHSDDANRDYLLRKLKGVDVPAVTDNSQYGYAVIVEKDADIKDVYVMKNGRRIQGSDHLYPRALYPFIFSSYWPAYYKADKLAAYLGEHGNKYPLILQTGGKQFALQFDGSLNYSCKTEMGIDGDMVSVSRLLLANDSPVDNVSCSGNFVFDAVAGRLCILKDKSGWQIWNELNRLSHDIPTSGFTLDDNRMAFHIPHRKFQESLLIFPVSEGNKPRHVMLKSGGNEAQPEIRQPAYRIMIKESADKKNFIMDAECCLDNKGFAPAPNLFRFFGELEDGLNAQLRAVKRKKVFIQTFFDMLSEDTVRKGEGVIKHALANGDFRKRKLKYEAGGFLKNYLYAFHTDENVLLCHNSKWITSFSDKRREIPLFKIPYEIFGWETFRDTPGYNRMVVGHDALYEKLPLLYDLLDAQGIELYLENKPVKTSEWDFSFDASRTTGIDWFEIRPEIRCDGKLIDDALFMKILSEKGVVEKDGCVRIMDSNARRIFETVSGILGTNSKSKGIGKEIVRVPRLQILDWLTLRNMGVKVNLPPDDEKIIERLTTFEKIEERPLPDRLKAKLRRYQKDGYMWLSFLYEHKFGACLADDMGLGKTVEAISFLAGIKEGKVASPKDVKRLPHLIVLPPSLLFNWESEIRRFYPDFKILFYTGIERSTDFSGCDAVLTTYAIARRDIEKLKDTRFNVIIFDEAQAVKNIYADTTSAVRLLNAHFKLTMTGTPLENHIGEYYSIIDLSLPGLLGDFETFKPMIKQDSSTSLNLIIRRTKPFVLRRTKEKILRELPPKIETDIYLDLTDSQKALYKKTVEQVRIKIDDAYRTKTQAQAQIIALTAILKLRQLCIAPQLIGHDMEDFSPKIHFLIERLQELIGENHSALVFSQFTSFLDLLEKELQKHKIGFLRLDGSTQVGKRKKLVEKFQNGEGPSVFLLSLKAGGQGLNLTMASYVFHLDPWWNPAVENQASDRAHRIGQKKTVTITRILMRHTIEEKMMALKKKKLEIYKAVMEEPASGSKGLKITKSDFQFLLG